MPFGRRSYGRKPSKGFKSFRGAKKTWGAAKKAPYKRSSQSLEKLQHAAARQAYLNAVPNVLSPAGQVIAEAHRLAAATQAKEALTLGVLTALATQLGVITHQPTSGKTTQQESPSIEQSELSSESEQEEAESQEGSRPSSPSQEKQSERSTDQEPTQTSEQESRSPSPVQESKRLRGSAPEPRGTQSKKSGKTSELHTWNEIQSRRAESSSVKQEPRTQSQLCKVCPVEFLRQRGQLPHTK